MTRFKQFIYRQYNKLFQHALLKKYKRVILYFIFGCTAASVDLAIYLILFNIVHIAAVISTIISISLATIVGFTLNALINFKVTDKLLLRFLSYASVSGVGMAISSAMLYIFHDLHGFDGNLIKIISLPIIFLVQYILNTVVSFRKARASKENEPIT